MNISVLVDNNTIIDQYYKGEPALSYFIEVDGQRILFDTGYSDILIENAEKMQIDLKSVTQVVLSHGHNDHTAGLGYLMERGMIQSATLLAHPDCFLPKYDDDEYIGMPCTAETLEGYLPCRKERGVVQLSEHLTYLGEIPRLYPFEAQEPIGYQIKNQCKAADYLWDDTALVYQNTEGIFIITGCSHSGICNIVAHAKKVCGCNRVLGILGGFHLFAEQERIAKTVETLKENAVECLYPCHCVSLYAKIEMAKALTVHEVGVGMEIQV